MKTLARTISPVLVVVACLAATTAAETPALLVKELVAVFGTDGVQRAEIVGGSYFYDPNRLVVKVNVPVELKIRKETGFTPHDFVIKAPEAGIDVNLQISTEPKIVTFTPTKTGEFPFYCSKKLLFLTGHREKGMEGVLVVR